jgi:hypothetical protein
VGHFQAIKPRIVLIFSLEEHGCRSYKCAWTNWLPPVPLLVPNRRQHVVVSANERYPVLMVTTPVLLALTRSGFASANEASMVIG